MNNIMTRQRGYYMALLIVMAHIFLSKEFVDARRIEQVKHTKLVKPKGTVKTIKSEDGDIIDCVEIYKQPAFDHPLLKNHTIEMKPSFYPKGIINLEQPKFTQIWKKKGECPQGTVPIRRAPKLDYPRRRGPQLHQSNIDEYRPVHEYAMVSQQNGNYYGAHASINIWNPSIELNSGEVSIAQIWLASYKTGLANTIEAGWMVYPRKYYDSQTRLFIYWTRDGYQHTGCYNLDCPGFIHTSQHTTLGGAISPISGLNSKQYDLDISIYKNKDTGNWWLKVGNEVLGYWPSSIFTSLGNSGTASSVSWGGEVVNTKLNGHHTSTQMGSGHFPNEGYGKSGYFHNLGVVDQSGTLRDPEKLEKLVTYPSCYDLQVQENQKTQFGTNFFFGGPGYSNSCR